MKPCRSPSGGFVPPANTPPAPMQLPIEIPFKFSTAKCHSCFCEAPMTCTPSVGPVPVSSSVPIVQQSMHTSLRCHQLPTTTLSSLLRPWRKKHIQIARLIPPCLILLMLLKSLTPQIVPSILVSSLSVFNDPFPAQQSVVPPSRSGFPIYTSTPTKPVMLRPLLTDALFHNSSSRVTTLSPIRHAEHNCPSITQQHRKSKAHHRSTNPQ